MRFKSKSVLLALVAVFAMSAVAVASASATTPEFKPVPAKKKFTSATGPVIFEGTGQITGVTCTGTSLKGEITGARTVGSVILTATGCTDSSNLKGNCPLSSVGAKAGELVSQPLTGELGTVSTSEYATGVALRFKAQTGKANIWFTLAPSQCNEEGEITGELAAGLSSIATKSTELPLSFEGSKGTPKIKQITLDSGTVEKLKMTFGTGALTVSSLKGHLSFEEALEVT